MPEVSAPITVRTDESDEVAKILIHADWYDWLRPIYRGLKTVGLANIKGAPEALEKFQNLLEYLTLEFGALGWVFSLSLLTVLSWAANKSLEVGKFIYQTSSALKTEGGALVTKGGALATVSSTSIKELPE